MNIRFEKYDTEGLADFRSINRTGTPPTELSVYGDLHRKVHTSHEGATPDQI